MFVFCDCVVESDQMETLNGLVTLPCVRAMDNSRIMRSGLLWGFRSGIKVGGGGGLSHNVRVGKSVAVRCSFSSSSNDNGSMAENFNENDDEYVNSTVVEAVEVKSGSDGFMIKMRDGRYMRCMHNSPQGGHLPDYAPHPAIVLKMEDGSDLLLPIIVLEMPSTLLMAALNNVQIVRPTMYQVMAEMVEKMGYVVLLYFHLQQNAIVVIFKVLFIHCCFCCQVKLVRVTKRVHEAYFAQLYLAKAIGFPRFFVVGNEKEIVSFDLRPSDAINIAVRCKVPIQVNKYLAFSDGMRAIEPAKLGAKALISDGLLFAELDRYDIENLDSDVNNCYRPDGQPCVEAKEFDLVRNMLIAAVEERYRDAGMVAYYGVLPIFLVADLLYLLVLCSSGILPSPLQGGLDY
ncbi:hypothetical protein IFM89_016567 [Coptis chinensis]|uniref:BFN domain-containing protein n=1 Tax=Coptis chinensis TaxID=261450 RepID=A0A835I1C8_9MAGN|nr:hypothetical protein IFM89_016567 [Coptis chinensis]